MKEILLFAAVALFFLSCQKEISHKEINDNVAEKGATAVTATLTSGAWTFTGVVLEYGPGEKEEGTLDECKSDDLYQYESNGYATVKHGSVPCSVDPEDGNYASWELLTQGKQLKEVYTRDLNGENAGTVVLYDIDFLSTTKLIISRTISEPGKTYKEYDTYTR